MDNGRDFLIISTLIEPSDAPLDSKGFGKNKSNSSSHEYFDDGNVFRGNVTLERDKQNVDEEVSIIQAAITGRPQRYRITIDYAFDPADNKDVDSSTALAALADVFKKDFEGDAPVNQKVILKELKPILKILMQHFLQAGQNNEMNIRQPFLFTETATKISSAPMTDPVYESSEQDLGKAPDHVESITIVSLASNASDIEHSESIGVTVISAGINDDNEKYVRSSCDDEIDVNRVGVALANQVQSEVENQVLTTLHRSASSSSIARVTVELNCKEKQTGRFISETNINESVTNKMDSPKSSLSFSAHIKSNQDQIVSLESHNDIIDKISIEISNGKSTLNDSQNENVELEKILTDINPYQQYIAISVMSENIVEEKKEQNEIDEETLKAKEDENEEQKEEDVAEQTEEIEDVVEREKNANLDDIILETKSKRVSDSEEELIEKTSLVTGEQTEARIEGIEPIYKNENEDILAVESMQENEVYSGQRSHNPKTMHIIEVEATSHKGVFPTILYHTQDSAKLVSNSSKKSASLVDGKEPKSTPSMSVESTQSIVTISVHIHSKESEFDVDGIAGIQENLAVEGEGITSPDSGEHLDIEVIQENKDCSLSMKPNQQHIEYPKTPPGIEEITNTFSINATIVSGIVGVTYRENTDLQNTQSSQNTESFECNIKVTETETSVNLSLLVQQSENSAFGSNTESEGLVNVLESGQLVAVSLVIESDQEKDEKTSLTDTAKSQEDYSQQPLGNDEDAQHDDVMNKSRSLISGNESIESENMNLDVRLSVESNNFMVDGGQQTDLDSLNMFAADGMGNLDSSRISSKETNDDVEESRLVGICTVPETLETSPSNFECSEKKLNRNTSLGNIGTSHLNSGSKFSETAVSMSSFDHCHYQPTVQIFISVIEPELDKNINIIPKCDSKINFELVQAEGMLPEEVVETGIENNVESTREIHEVEELQKKNSSMDDWDTIDIQLNIHDYESQRPETRSVVQLNLQSPTTTFEDVQYTDMEGNSQSTRTPSPLNLSEMDIHVTVNVTLLNENSEEDEKNEFNTNHCSNTISSLNEHHEFRTRQRLHSCLPRNYNTICRSLRARSVSNGRMELVGEQPKNIRSDLDLRSNIDYGINDGVSIPREYCNIAKQYDLDLLEQANNSRQTILI